MRLCIQWPRFGPYHLARLRAAHAYLAERGVELVGLETASEDALYAWRVEDAEESFRREQTLPGRVFENVLPAEMHRATIAALDRIDPDAVGIMSWGYPDARAALVWCRRRRRTAILMTDTKADDAPRVRWREALKRLLAAQFDSALVAGSLHRDYLVALGFPADRITFGYDVVDNARFREGAAAARAAPTSLRHLPGLESAGTPAFVPYFLASNRFIPRKNLDRLVLAYGRYRQQASLGVEPPWRLLLLGDGPDRHSLASLVAREQIAGVVFCGFRQVEELPAYYGLAQTFVHPALTDQWGLVINEAMAAGLPVLASTGAGATHDLVIEGENGYRFDPLDEEVLASAMIRIATSEEVRALMGKASLQRIAAWDLNRFVEGLSQALKAGQPHAVRAPNPLADLVLTTSNRLARSTSSYHSLQV